MLPVQPQVPFDKNSKTQLILEIWLIFWNLTAASAYFALLKQSLPASLSLSASANYIIHDKFWVKRKNDKRGHARSK